MEKDFLHGADKKAGCQTCSLDRWLGHSWWIIQRPRAAYLPTSSPSSLPTISGKSTPRPPLTHSTASIIPFAYQGLCGGQFSEQGACDLLICSSVATTLVEGGMPSTAHRTSWVDSRANTSRPSCKHELDAYPKGEARPLYPACTLQLYNSCPMPCHACSIVRMPCAQVTRESIHPRNPVPLPVAQRQPPGCTKHAHTLGMHHLLASFSSAVPDSQSSSRGQGAQQHRSVQRAATYPVSASSSRHTR